MNGLAVGQIVHYVLESGRNKGEHRPAIVVRDWSNQTIPESDGLVNLQVFTDGYNDGFLQSNGDTGANTIWRTSVHFSETQEPGTWHWPEHLPGAQTVTATEGSTVRNVKQSITVP